MIQRRKFSLVAAVRQYKEKNSCAKSYLAAAWWPSPPPGPTDGPDRRTTGRCGHAGPPESVPAQPRAFLTHARINAAALQEAHALVVDARARGVGVSGLREEWERVALCEVAGNWGMVGPDTPESAFSTAPGPRTGAPISPRSPAGPAAISRSSWACASPGAGCLISTAAIRAAGSDHGF